MSSANFDGAFSVASSDYGADGAGSIVWDYGLSVVSPASGLTSDGVAIELSMNGDVVEGRANGVLVFTLAVNDTTGVVTLTQYEEIDHALPGASSNYDSQFARLGSGLVELTGTATITDGDGDTAEDTVVLDLGGRVRFADDGPAIDATVTDGDAVTLTTFDADTVGGTSVDVSVADFGGAFSVASSDYGADGAGSIAWDYSLVIDNAASGLTSDGVPVELSMNGDVVEGRANGVLVFTVAVDGTTGVVTLTQYEEIDHDLPGSGSDYDSQLEALANGVLSLSGTATITDGDGDTAEETVLLDLGGNIRFADDGPRAGDNPRVLLDDDALPNGNAGGIGDDADIANTTGTLRHDFGADGGGSIAFTTTGAPAGFQYVASGSDILIQQDQGSGFVTVITVTLDPLTGDYTVTQNLPVVHADGNDENNLLLNLRYNVTDGDGDTATGTLRINVDDDTPIASGDAFVANVQAASFQTGFILDFSGSISSSELQTQLNAVRSVATRIFQADPNAEIFVTIFASNALNLNAGQAFTSLSALNTALNFAAANRFALVGNNTNFSAAVEAFAQSSFDPVVGSQNQVFFLSDGNPNRRGNVNDALDDAAETTWQNYFDNSNPPFSITTIGVGNGIQNGPLQEVDIDGAGAPILVANFDALQQALIDALDLSSTNTGNVISGEYNGSVMGGIDAAGADGSHAVTITIGGRTYTYDGTNITIPGGGSGTDAGNGVLTGVRTPLGGTLEFNFETGEFVYTTPNFIPGGAATAQETFTYQIIDGDGDPSEVVPFVIDLVRLPALAMGSASANEGDALDFDIALTQPSNEAITVQLSLVDGTATQGSDFAGLNSAQISFDGGNTFVALAANGQFTIPAGSRPDIVVRIAGVEDTVYEGGAESFQLIAEVIGGRVFENTVSGTGEIIDDDAPTGAITFSTSNNATFHGVTISDEDIGRWDGTTASVIFDGDALFGNNADIDGVHVFSGSGTVLGVSFDDGDLLISTRDGETLGGISFADEDIVLYDVSTGMARLVLDGSSIGADTDVDAVSVLEVSPGVFDLIFSMDSDETVAGISIEDGDLLRYNGSNVTVFFDEDNGFGNGGFVGGADIDGVHVLSATEFLFTVESDGASIAGLSGIQDGDVIFFNGSNAIEVLDENTFFSGNENIDALDPSREALAMLLSGVARNSGNNSDIVNVANGNDTAETSRLRETTVIAASAAAFAVPSIEAQFGQEYGDLASPGDHMVNFEFAAAPTLEAPRMPEGYAMAFDGRVEFDEAAGQELAMANILGNGGDFQSSISDMVSAPEIGGFDYAAAEEGFSAMPSAFEGLAMGDTGSAMEALLMLEANAPAANATGLTDAGRALGEAVADLAAEAQVDDVVAHFAANDTGAGFGDAISVPVEGLLDGMIGNDLPFHAVGIAQADQTDEAALAAASA